MSATLCALNLAKILNSYVLTTSSVSTLDIILILCFVPFLITGFRKGFAVQLCAVASIVLGVWLSFRFSKQLCLWLSPYLHVSGTVMQIIAFIIVMIVVILALYLLGKLLKGVIKLVMLGWLDRLLGVVFSLANGLLVMGILIILFNTLNNCLNLVNNDFFSDCRVYNFIKDLAYRLFPYFKELLIK